MNETGFNHLKTRAASFRRRKGFRFGSTASETRDGQVPRKSRSQNLYRLVGIWGGRELTREEQGDPYFNNGGSLAVAVPK